MGKFFLVGTGGFVGAVLRYVLSGLAQQLHQGTFPLGTLVVNILGCLVIGLAMAMVEERALISPDARLFLMMGLLGSFTTFSALGYETLEMLRNQQLLSAFCNITANIVLGVGATGLGWFTVRIAAV